MSADKIYHSLIILIVVLKIIIPIILIIQGLIRILMDKCKGTWDTIKDNRQKIFN